MQHPDSDDVDWAPTAELRFVPAAAFGMERKLQQLWENKQEEWENGTRYTRRFIEWRDIPFDPTGK